MLVMIYARNIVITRDNIRSLTLSISKVLFAYSPCTLNNSDTARYWKTKFASNWIVQIDGLFFVVPQDAGEQEEQLVIDPPGSKELPSYDERKQAMWVTVSSFLLSEFCFKL